ncbi:hypothetical protein HF521_012338 [Silurus meridionalis]|uniref:Corticotropin n=1 Tax=Silurus meridionalis TaxID=175797 RepID=A0A8T0AEJ3_SILME|nr:hypothetical protein HF521_012338 [Silurus meridionalis]
MQCVSWLCAALVLCVCGPAVDGRCSDLADCRELDSQDKTIECLWQCRLKLLVRNIDTLLPSEQPSTEEDKEDEVEGDSLSLGALLTSLGPSEASLPSVRPQRSGERPPTYSMEHFRWGKPTSRKRRPVRVHTTVSMDNEDPEEVSMEMPFLSLNRRQMESSNEQNNNTKSTTKYRITHFRWSAPPASKRYGGFMKSWTEKSHKPLLTLLRNIIVTNRQ